MNISDIELPSNRNFGLFFAGAFALFSGYLFNQNAQNPPWIFAGLAIVFLVVAVTKSELLLPLNKLWMGFGLLIGMIASPIVLGLIFFVLFAPIGIVMRLAGRDELNLKLISASSYWKVRNPTGPTADSFKHQF